MLVEFRVENYRSFGSVQRLSMLAGTVKNNPSHVTTVHDRRILTSAAVFGANASGKTNLVRAMREAQMKIVFNIHIPVESWNRNDPSNRELPTGFEFVFTTKTSVFAYGFNVMAETGRVVSEWLHDMTSGDVCIFEIENRKINHDWNDDATSNKLDIISGMVREDQGDLLLPLLARMDDPGNSIFIKAREAMNWFSSNLVIMSANMPAPVISSQNHDDYIRRALGSYGTGITNMRYEKMDRIPPDILLIDPTMEQRLRDGQVGIIRSPSGCIRLSYDDGIIAERTVFEHKGIRFDFNEESDGTRRLFDLLPIIERDPSVDITFVIDELDRSLHPQLTRKFIRDFLKIAKEKSRQLIFTTHEVMLLELEILRRDEFWFVEKGKNDSTIYSLEDFKERIDRKIVTSYMDGRYGAIPAFLELYPDLE